MADATTLPNVSPKQLGKQLRAVRRRKGLSLSEVARGAGLSRRELVAYERGKGEIPESDLWVIAGSCGVDVAELVPPTDPKALPSAPASIEDSITQLRRAQPGDRLQRHLDTLYALRALPAGSVVQLEEVERVAMADALGGDAGSIERRLVETMRVSKDEAKRLRALVVPDTPRYSPLALDPPAPVPASPPLVAAPVAAHDATAVFGANGVAAPDLTPGLTPVREPDLSAGPVDVFEELAKLPEPVALPDQQAAGHDMFAPPPEPVTVAAAAEAGSGPFAAWSSMRSALPEPSAPVVVEPAAPASSPATSFGASHAPPIDVVGHVDAPGAPNGWSEPIPVNGDGGFAPLHMSVGSNDTDVIEPVGPVGYGASPDEDVSTRGSGGWDAWWTPPSATTNDAVIAGAPAWAPPEMPVPFDAAVAPAVAADAPPTQMVEFVDEYVVEPPTSGPESFVPGSVAPEPSAFGSWSPSEPTTIDGAASWAPPTEVSWSSSGGVGDLTAAAYASPLDAPMTDAERFAAGGFAPAPTDAGAPEAPMTDAERAASGAWPSWEPADAPVPEAPAATDTWSPPEPVETAGTDAWSPPESVTTQSLGTQPDFAMETPWGRQPDAEASNTGFYVDWGPADEVDAPVVAVTDTVDDPWVAAALDTQVGEPTPPPFVPAAEEPVLQQSYGEPVVVEWPSTLLRAPEVEPAPPAAEPEPVSAEAWTPSVDSWAPVDESWTPVDESWTPVDEPAPISWRPLADSVLAAVAVEMATCEPDAPSTSTFDGDAVETFTGAGEEWELGNALPLVEVRAQGGLVMRRADERWALADVRSSANFALEVDVDFRSGPGFGVLFRACTDDDGHMSGYSFDVDPIHEGGSYLVRQWQGDRELWNPIAHVPAPDPSDMHGALTLRVVVLGDSVTASVNGVVVLTVESLEQACAERNRDPVSGDRVGIQAWSSSDLVIDALRVAER